MALISLGLMAGKALLGGGSSGRTSAVPVKQTKIPSSAFRQKRPITQKIPKTSPLGGYGMVVSRGPLPKNAFLMPQVGSGAGGDTLEETNNILFDIQKLLVADYTDRISKEQQQLKAIKSLSDKEERERKESVLEAFKKVSAVSSSVAGKIVAPFRNPLAAILGFLKNVLAGFVTNKSLQWLSENKEKVRNAFDWFRKNWEGIRNTTLAVLGGALLLDIGTKLYTAYRIATDLFNMFRGKKPPITPKPSPQGSGGGVNTGYVSRGSGFRSPGRYRLPDQARAGGFRLEQLRRGASGTSLPKGGRFNFRGMRGGLAGVLLLFASMFQDELAGGIGGLYNKLGIGIGNLSDQDLLKEYQMTLGYKDTPFDDPTRRNLLIKELDKRGLAYNRGGIIPGGGPDRDSRLIAATPGEYLINRKNTNRFLPFLDDINYSGGLLYSSMYKALKEQDKNADSFAKTNKKFDRVLNDYKKVIEKKGGSSGSISGSSSAPKVTAPSMNTSGGLTPKSDEGKINFVNLVPSKTPQNNSQSLSTPAGGDSVPVLDATDTSNPYIAYVMKEFGILGG